MPDEIYLTTTETPGGTPDRGAVRVERNAGHDVYEVVGHEAQWRVAYEGERGMAYATKEAAFEAAVAAASNAMKDGHEVTIRVPGAVAGESMLGTQASG